jgi:peptidyl-prolyl cis-trans isomerase D
MLQTLRSSVGSILIKALFALLVASFAVWGISDTYIFGQPSDAVADVGEQKISVNALQDAFRGEVQRLRPLNIDEAKARQLGILDQVLERLISATLYDEGARKMGMVVGEEALRQTIRTQLGDIGPTEFQNVLRNNGMSEQQYLSRLRGQIIRSQYLESLTQGTQAPKPLIDQLYAWREEKREAALATIPVDPKSKMRMPTDTEIEAFYKSKPHQYTAPEYRGVRFVYLDPKKAAESIKVAEEKLQEVYTERLPTLGVPEKRQLQQMLVPDTAAADRAAAMLKEGKSFVAVAKAVANQDESATNLGTLTKQDLPKALADAAFDLKSGETSAPIKGPFGLQIIRAALIIPGKTPSFEDVRASLEQDIVKEEALEAIFAQVNKLEDVLGSGGTLNDAAADLGLTVRTVQMLDKDGHDSKDNPVGNLPGAPFLKTVFETDEGQESLVTETSETGYFVLAVDSIVKPALRPLAEVRREVVDDWQADQRWKAARARAKNAIEALKKGEKIADLARKNGWKHQKSKPFSRNGNGAPSDMPPALVSDLFAAKSVNQAFHADSASGVQIAQLTEISESRPTADPKGVDALGEVLKLGISNDIAAQLGTALRARHDVTVNREAIQYYFYRDAGES